MRAGAMFPEINALPGSQRQFTVDQGDAEGGLGQCATNMGRHVVRPLAPMTPAGLAVGRQGGKKGLKIAADIGIGVFLDQQRGRGVPAEYTVSKPCRKPLSATNARTLPVISNRPRPRQLISRVEEVCLSIWTYQTGISGQSGDDRLEEGGQIVRGAAGDDLTVDCHFLIDIRGPGIDQIILDGKKKPVTVRPLSTPAETSIQPAWQIAATTLSALTISTTSPLISVHFSLSTLNRALLYQDEMSMVPFFLRMRRPI